MPASTEAAITMFNHIFSPERINAPTGRKLIVTTSKHRLRAAMGADLPVPVANPPRMIDVWRQP
jgi:hypothetical protein